MGLLSGRLGAHLRTMLIARTINQHFGTHYDAADIERMTEVDLEEMLTWIDASR